jgi:glutathione synthase/RimK-type ligase-like ATP-grasp enzyme
MACEIQTEKLDFRDDDDPTIVPVELPEGVASDCLAIARKLELLWTGIDLRRTDDGQYFYFEANPSPMFMGFEERCGLPLTKALGDLLCVH